MITVNVFNDREYLYGNVYSYKNTNVISSIDPNNLSFAADSEKPKSGGCCVRFITNSPKIKIVYSITNPISGNFPHVGITAQRGLSCSYRRIDENHWRNVDCFNYRDGSAGEIQIPTNIWNPRSNLFEMIVYFPINCFITRFELMIDDGCEISPCKDLLNHKIMILGGGISYGFGISSTQFQLSSLLTRHIANSSITNVAFYRRDLWDAYEKILPFLPELEQQKLLLLEIPFYQGDIDVIKETVFNVLTALCKRVGGKIILWYKPCYEKEYLSWSPLFEQFVSDNGQSSKIIFDKSFLLKNNTEYDMYMSSVNFVNDNGNIFIMKQIIKLTEDIWNT